MTVLFMEGFKPGKTERALFSRSPHLTLRQAFQAISAPLPPAAHVTFYKQEDGIAACIRPHGQPGDSGDEAMLSYQLFPEHDSVIIRRIDAGPLKRAGLGSAMIRSQLPFWERMGAHSIGLRTHGLAEGFYLRLGFTRVDDLPEYQGRSIITMMRLDLHHPEQRACLERALAKAPALRPV